MGTETDKFLIREAAWKAYNKYSQHKIYAQGFLGGLFFMWRMFYPEEGPLFTFNEKNEPNELHTGL